MANARRMLIVDDERGICNVLTRYFSARGFTVQTAFSGEEALQRLAEGAPDFLLLDILLPGISGIEVLKQAKARYPRLRVVMITAFDQVELWSEARLYGAVGYVTKPFDFDDPTWSSPLFADPFTKDSP